MVKTTVCRFLEKTKTNIMDKFNQLIMRKILLVLFLTIAASAQADWTAIDSPAKKGETHYFDLETVRKNDHFRKVWVLSSYDKKQTGGYHSIKTFYEFDCTQEKARSVTMLLYPDTKATGDVIGAHHEESTDWFDIPSDSMFSQITRVVCD